MFPFVTGEGVLGRAALTTQHQMFSNPMSLDESLDEEYNEAGLKVCHPEAEALVTSADMEAVFDNHLGDLAPMDNGGQKCLICAKTFTQLGSAKRHVVEVHKPGQRPFDPFVKERISHLLPCD